MKPALLLATVATSVLLSSCCTKNGLLCKTVTLENRRDMYFPQKVEGPYTRMTCKGIPSVKKETVVTTTATTTEQSWGK